MDGLSVACDLHIHSCLSPCAADDMTPGNIIGMAALCGLDAVAVTDHNSCLNLPATCHFARQAGIVLVPAMELTTSEEVHVLCYFPSIEAALGFSETVRATLPPVKQGRLIFGRQIITDLNDEQRGEEERLLSMASGIGIYEVSSIMDSFGGVAAPAHADRQSFSLYANLGFYDSGMNFSCMELSRHLENREGFIAQHPELSGMRIITGSDSHELESLPTHAAMRLQIGEKSAAGIIAALKGKR